MVVESVAPAFQPSFDHPANVSPPGSGLHDSGGISVTAKRRKALRRHEELIERKVTYFEGGERKQRTRKVEYTHRNPEKLTIAVGGDWEVFAYPYMNPEKIFLRIRDAVECFEPKDLSRLFSRVSSRIRRYTTRLGRGVKRRDFSGCLFQSALEAGIRRFSEQQSRNDLLYIRGVVFMEQCETCSYYKNRLQSDGLCHPCAADRKRRDWMMSG